jgi:hypothetical protein
MRRTSVLCLAVGLVAAAALAGAWDLEPRPASPRLLGDIDPARLVSGASCTQHRYYLLEDCAYVTVLGGVAEGTSFGVCFDMLDTLYNDAPCDTSRCLTLDVIGLVFYDVLAPPSNQGMNVKIVGADRDFEPLGDLLGNRDFTPSFAESAAFAAVKIDFTNGGTEPGLDLSGCGGRFIVLLTWENATGYPALVLDNISTCADSCAAEAACCAMGHYPFFFPRRTHTFYYGTEWAWSKQDSVCDSGGCPGYGPLEALWTCGFCTMSTSTEPASWGGRCAGGGPTGDSPTLTRPLWLRRPSVPRSS